MTLDSEQFQSEVNKDFGDRFENEIDQQIEVDFQGFHWEKVPSKKSQAEILTAAGMTHSEFQMMETLFKNPETSVPAHMRNPLD